MCPGGGYVHVRRRAAARYLLARPDGTLRGNPSTLPVHRLYLCRHRCLSDLWRKSDKVPVSPKTVPAQSYVSGSRRQPSVRRRRRRRRCLCERRVSHSPAAGATAKDPFLRPVAASRHLPMRLRFGGLRELEQKACQCGCEEKAGAGSGPTGLGGNSETEEQESSVKPSMSP